MNPFPSSLLECQTCVTSGFNKCSTQKLPLFSQNICSEQNRELNKLWDDKESNQPATKGRMVTRMESKMRRSVRCWRLSAQQTHFLGVLLILSLSDSISTGAASSILVLFTTPPLPGIWVREPIVEYKHTCSDGSAAFCPLCSFNWGQQKILLCSWSTTTLIQ